MKKYNISNIIEKINNLKKNYQFIGHNNIVNFFKLSIRKNLLYNTFLFNGIQGIGKSTLVYHIAWNLLNNEKEFIAPNNDSVLWHNLLSNSYPGILKIEKSFNSKVNSAITLEDIFYIKKFLYNKDPDNNWRIIIIDSIDNININASNALLKIIEESPKKTLFFLIYHGYYKIIPTIKSRCQLIFFRPMNHIEIYKILDLLNANIEYSKKEIEFSISKSEGSIRKALIMLKYNGILISNNINLILKSNKFPLNNVEKLIHYLIDDYSNLKFNFFLDYILNIIYINAKKHIIYGNKKCGVQMSKLWKILKEEIENMYSYNIDKKFFSFVVLKKLYFFSKKYCFFI